MFDIHKIKALDNERGAVLVVALLIMAVMSLIGTAAITTSTIDIQISTNTRTARQAFYCADGGVEMSPKLVRTIVDEGIMPALPYVTLNANLLNEVMGYATEAASTDAVSPAVVNPDLQMSMGGQTVYVDIDRVGKAFMGGSGAEFGAGAEGVGAGVSGGVLIFYDFDSLGTAGTNARSHVEVLYRYVVGTAGGK